jgi:hypothetical protein
MRQHPIPQNILDVEFKLFTKFTIREFAYMAIGVGFGGIFLYFFTKGQLPSIIAFPIFLVSSGAGLFLGLVPINDQKADVFLRNYFVAITTPTRRVWRNEEMDQKIKPVEITQGTMSRDANNPEKTKIIGTTRENTMKDTMVEPETVAALDQEEKQKLEKIEQNAKEAAGGKVTTPVPKVETKADIPVPTPVTPGKVLLTSQNLPQYSVALPTEVKLIGTLNVLINDKQGNPVQDAIVTVKDSAQRVVSAYRSNRSGLILTEKMLQPGTYYVSTSLNQRTFPQFQVLIEGMTPIVFKITEI